MLYLLFDLLKELNVNFFKVAHPEHNGKMLRDPHHSRL